MDKFEAVTSSRIRLSIVSVSSATPSIREFEMHLDDGPNLTHSDSLIVKRGNKAAMTIYWDSPNESNLRQALDTALTVYDVEIRSDQKLRYIRKVKGQDDVYFFANIGEKKADASVQLRGRITPEVWNPHSGQCSVPEYTHTIEDAQSVTAVRLNITPIHSLVIIGKQFLS